MVQGGAAGIDEDMLEFWGKVFDLGGGDYFDITNIYYINFGDRDTLNMRRFRELL